MEITLTAPLDMHLHLREGAMLAQVAPLSARDFAGGLIMPNLVPPVTTPERLRTYKEEIRQAIAPHTFTPYMTLFFTPHYTYDFLAQIRDEILAIKLYPAGVTTNSQEGVASFDLDLLAPTLEAMSQLQIPLCVHGETNGFVLDREAQFLPIYKELAQAFPDLTIVMEHITTHEAVQTLLEHENLHATITLHHLFTTLDDLAGGLLRPHLFCKPIPKRPEDRQALRELAFSAHERVMFGSDSAPHPRSKKEAPGCAAGVFTAPLALPALVQLFEEANALEALQAFVSDNARRIYRIDPPAKQVRLVKEPWQVPESYGDVVPFLAGTTLSWRVDAL
ncbi:MAG: dihydroorotase [Nitratiruptor sp.]|nr:dihydroorotase [Nitratiruptor sp.]NPA84312.1 dihydroorotase [Campylobacterota bacterium]